MITVRMVLNMAGKWLDEAVFYEIYPQSFKDSNADGIGDLNGIIEKLDYIRELGCDAVWMNPCFDSPFVDAGYDVRDFYKVAQRYGTNEDLKRLCDVMHEKGMHLILDLVAGHTSIECEWFRQSCLPEKNKYTDRYVWTDTVWNAPKNVGNIMGWLRGGYDRDGAAAVNFFTAQPALNYGFAVKDEGCDWEQSPDDEGPMSTKAELKNIMKFWLDMGADGFRVDMAGSLVKNDPDSKGTIRLWQDIREWLDREYPDAVIVSEWGEADKALEAGFDMDFVLHFGPSHYPDLFRTERPYFAGQGSAEAFFDLYLKNLAKTKDGNGLICIPSGNHDMYRMAKTLTPDQMRIAFAFLLTMPGIPFIYYGDELGMNYVEGLHSKEGGYYRTGARSPMQWDRTVNAGFSTAPESLLYIPQDKAHMDEINAETEMNDPDSLWNEVRRLIALRKQHPSLSGRSGFRMINYHGYPLVYERSSGTEQILVILNPSRNDIRLDTDHAGTVLYSFAQKKIRDHIIPAQSAFIIQK